jgi:hypothetical protein
MWSMEKIFELMISLMNPYKMGRFCMVACLSIHALYVRKYSVAQNTVWYYGTSAKLVWKI